MVPLFLLPGDIILWRDSTSPISIVIDNKSYGYWEDATLFLGDNNFLVGHTPRISSWNPRAYDTFAVFRVFPALTYHESFKIIKTAKKHADVIPTWWENTKNWFRKLFHKEALVKYGKKCNNPVEFIAVAYEAAGRKLSPMLPCEMSLHDIDGSESLVRIF